MANRRMFSMDIVRNGKFLSLDCASRELYFQINMGCDDDGVCDSYYSILKITDAKQQDLDNLIHNKFLLYFDKIDVVVVKHWWIHNTKRKDRYKPSRHLKDLKLYLDENDAYTTTKTDRLYNSDWQPAGNQVATTRQPSGNQVATQDKISKDKISKDKISECSKKTPAHTQEKVSFDEILGDDLFNSLTIEEKEQIKKESGK